MFYQAFSIGIAILAAILVLVALRFIVKRDWFLLWLKGTLALAVLMAGVGLALAALDLYSYRAVVQETNVATVGIKKIEDHLYQVLVATPGGEERSYELRGDLWQLDARVITWHGPLAAVGLAPGYRIDRLSGRFISLEQERKAERTVYEVEGSNLGFDVWKWLNNQEWVPWIDANYGAATYMPMKDSAQYVVSLSNKGMLARPLNSVAVDAVESWQ